MKGVLVDSLYAIYDTATGKFVKYGNTVAWNSSGEAKSIFVYHETGYHTADFSKFENQNRYIVVTIDAELGIGHVFLES